MSDEIDKANEFTDTLTDAEIKRIRKAAKIPKGEPGECDLCGEWSGRLVNEVCAPCRDKYKLK
jgi:hypothetical protein